MDSELIRILDNDEDPFTDSDIRDKSLSTPNTLPVFPPQQQQQHEDLLSSSFEFSDDDIDDEMIAALKAIENEPSSGRTKRMASTPIKKQQPTKHQKKPCAFIQPTTTATSSSPLMSSPALSQTNNVTDPSKQPSSTLLSSSPATISQVRNPFRIPTQFQRNYATKPTTPIDPHHTLVLATQNPAPNQKKLTSEDIDEQDSLSKNVRPIILSNEQEYVLKQVLSGVSLFYTGSAGTGKSVLLRNIIKSLRAKHTNGGVAVTASTGLAACNIGGITLHSFAGFGLGQGKVDTLLRKIKRNKKAFNRWISTKVLIIDEISMVDGHMMDKLNELAKRIRKNNAPFGGIQVVACGDFYQLPPVVKQAVGDDGEEIGKKEEVFFAFECDSWGETIQQTIFLKEIFRQKGDQVFIDMLNEIRTGSVSFETRARFKELSRPLTCPEGFVPSELYATRYEVENSNNRKLSTIKGGVVSYHSIDSGTLPEKQRNTLLQNFLAPQHLSLKIGAQVMCIKNFDDKLVNGTLGKVVAFVDKDTYMKANRVAKSNDKDQPVDEKPELEDFIFNDFKAPPPPSRLKKEKKVREDAPIAEQQEEEFLTTSQIAEKHESLRDGNTKRKSKLEKDLLKDFKNRQFPLVKFLLPDGATYRTVLVEPEQWTVDDDDGNVLISRVQFPLILAWSLSIHKSQGQTLSKVVVDMKKIFETGQAYVALSRAVSRNGLQVLNFNASKVSSHPKVVKFYQTLNSHEHERLRGQQKLQFGSSRKYA
ncbi:hypothetical protein G210_1338 [Candida maltosa Xu316]|uniref:ATP-dependent DNA helicase PIF1 n=1 Tax=Candida maltosa (strain Xu316) TaxID=1245528 RepID=M3IP21_CANMX|nr:hypothetical protein G210_1338 [Candida maltosa Xu316]